MPEETRVSRIEAARTTDVEKSCKKEDQGPQVTRRNFLGGATTVAVAASTGAMALLTSPVTAEAKEVAPFNTNDPDSRVRQLVDVRDDAARRAGELVEKAFPHPTNGDEERFRNQSFAGNFSKTLPHDPATGLVIPSAYLALVDALEDGTQEAFDAVPAGGTGKLAGPLSPLQFQLQGTDSTAAKQLFVPPSIASVAGAAVYGELYWEAFVRDVPFINFASNPLIAQAAADLNKFSAFAGPRPVTPQNIFRYGTSSIFPNANAFFGATAGPYVSQILYQTHQLDGVTFVPQIRTNLPVADPNTGQVLTGPGTGLDFMTNFPEYLFVENGNGALDHTNVTDPQNRFIRSGRDLGSLVNQDSIYSIYFRAAILLSALGIPLDANSPYTNDKRISGFNTFSTGFLFNMVGAAQASEAQAFYQKWFVTRHLRPEAFGNLVDGVLTNRFTLNPSIHAELVNSAVLPLIFERNRQLNVKRGMGTTGSFLLPQISAGGSPSHPDSASGHAFTAGCSVTVLKAILDVGTPENPRPWPAPPVQASADGLSLVPTSDKLTVLGELNKLAFNIAEGRNWLGIHSRVGGNSLGMTLGEDTAIQLLEQLGATYPEKNFKGFTLTKFDGTTILVGASKPI